MFYVNRNKGAFSLLIIVIIAISSVSVFVNAEETPPLRDKKILIIHSYHQGLAWTDGQDKGIREVLKSQENVEISTEYLDTKRFAFEKILDHFAKYIEQKYSITKFDVIIVTDNNALSFVSQYYSKLFSGIPVVFCGINNFQPDMLKKFNGLATGVVQVLDPKGTFDLIKKLQPELERLVVVSGTTPTAQAIRDEVKKELAVLDETQPILWLDGLKTDDLLGKLEKLSKNYAVLLCNFNRDAQDNYYSHEKSGRMISKTSDVPVYAMEDHYLGTGVTGGYMNSSRDQGVAAGTICLDILNTGNIPDVIMTSPNMVMFDYNAMLRFGLDISALPYSAVIINQPVSFYKQYKTLIWNIVVVFCLLLLALFGVSFGLMRVRLAKREVARSEENLRITLNSIGDAVIVVNTEGSIVRMNPVAERLTGCKFGDAKNRPLTDIFRVFDARTKEPVVNPVKRVLETGQISTLAKHTMLIAKDGAQYQIVDSAAPISNVDGNVIGVVLVFRDVADEYLMQKELLDSEERLRILFEQAADAIYVARPDGKLVQINNEACQSIGYTKEELLDLNVSDINAEMRTPEAFREFSKTLSSGQSVTIESSHRRKDGSVYPVEVTISCLETPDGPNVLAIVRDITERKQVQKALKESEKKYRTLFEQSADATLIIEGDKIIDCNKATLDMFGYATRNELFNTHPSQLSPEFQPDGKSSFEKANEMMSIAYERDSHRFEWDHKRSNGEVFPVEVLLTGIELADRKFLYVVCRDITDRKKSEDRLRSERIFSNAIIKALPGLFYIFEINSMRFVRGNDNWSKVTGYSEDELDKMTALDFFEEGPERDLCADRMQEVYNNGSSLMENLFLIKSGKKIPYCFTGERLVIDGQTYLAGLGLDIADRKLAEKQREKLFKTLEYKNRELQDIVYMASHDLRSPLVNIEGFSGELESDCNHLMELLEEQADGNDKREQIKPLIKEEIPQSLSFIKSGAKKMSSLLDGLLQISRVGTVEIHNESLDIEKVVREILTSMQHQINESNITVTVDSLPGCIGDTHMLDHVFTNLFSNAIKYRDQKKEGTIRISGKIENNMSIYCVWDNGIGIALGHQKKVFEIFHRLNLKSSVGGEGLGLTIVTRIMARLGGEIWLESEPGKGSKFFIALPTV